MSGSLNMSNNKIINVKNATDNSDAVNFQQLNNSVSTVTNVSEILYLKKNGTTPLTGNLNLNNFKITNLQQQTHDTDSINLKQLKESHITSHPNREHVFEYVMKLSSEFSADFGINSVNLVNNFEEMPHLKKTAFVFSLQKSNQNSEYKGKFDINLF